VNKLTLYADLLSVPDSVFLIHGEQLRCIFSGDKVLAIQITYTVYRYTDDCTLADFEFLRVKVDMCAKK